MFLFRKSFLWGVFSSIILYALLRYLPHGYIDVWITTSQNLLHSLYYGRPIDQANQVGPWLTVLQLSEAEQKHLSYYCESPDLPDSRAKSEILLGVQMLIRHGDRGTLFDVKSSSHQRCPFDDDYQFPSVFHSYHDHVKGLDHKTSSADFAFVPQKAVCANGELTDKGVLQHLELGTKVRNRIGNEAETWFAPNMSVYSTRFARTYQSALAFMHGAAPNWKPGADHVTVAPRRDTNFCTLGGTCSCSNHATLYEKYRQKKSALFRKDAETNKLIRQLNTLLSHHLESNLSDWLIHVFDVLLQFACHGQQMPCYHGTCVTYQELVEIVTVLEQVAEDISDDPVVRQLTALEAYGLFKVMADNLKLILSDTSGKAQKFTLFSAHDVTVIPLIHVLGLPFKIVVPYASYVLVEAYRLTEYGSETFVRIIYNGRDITMETVFAKELDGKPCPIEKFLVFVEETLKVQFDASCDLK